MTCRAYCRVSTTRQADRASLETQREAITRYATAQGRPVERWYTDVLSGRRDDRPAYQQLLRELEPGDTLYVWRLDRVGRKKSELFRLFEECKQRRINLISVTQPELSNELARDLMSVIAAYESQQIAERVLPGMLTRTEQGKRVTRPPRWYVNDPNQRLVPTDDAHEAQAAFEMVLTTRSLETTAAAFGIHTFSLRYILRNRAYLGETEWNGVIVPDTHPAIVKRATWEAVQAMFADRQAAHRREPRGTALLTGYLYVRETDERLYHYIRRRRTEGVNRYYVTKSGHHTPYHSIRAEVAERAVVDALMTLSLTPAQAQEVARRHRETIRTDPDKRERAMLTRRIAALDAERTETNRMEAQRRITPAEADQMRKRQDEERAAFAARLSALPPLVDRAALPSVLTPRLDLAARIEDAYQAGYVTALRHLVAYYVARVEVWGGEGFKGYKFQPAREVRVIWNEKVLS